MPYFPQFSTSLQAPLAPEQGTNPSSAMQRREYEVNDSLARERHSSSQTTSRAKARGKRERSSSVQVNGEDRQEGWPSHPNTGISSHGAGAFEGYFSLWMLRPGPPGNEIPSSEQDVSYAE